MNTRLSHRLIAGIALATALTLAGCAPTSTAPSETTSAQLEQTVLAITTAVAAGDWTTADLDLDTLSAQVDAALADGSLSVQRAAEIRAAIELVRGDIAAAIAPPVEAPAPTPSTIPSSEKPGNGNGNGNGNNKGDDDDEGDD